MKKCVRRDCGRDATVEGVACVPDWKALDPRIRSRVGMAKLAGGVVAVEYADAVAAAILAVRGDS